LNFTTLYILPDGFADQVAIPPSPIRFPVRFTGTTGALKGGAIYTNASQYINFPMTANLSNSGGIQLNSGVTHTTSYLSSIGGDETSFNRVFFRSITPGTQATLNLTGTQGVFYTNFTDINASGGNTIYTYGGTAANSSNIQTITSYVPTSASTFVN
jgi:hypothetical protein